jgi:hypothetical protein
MKTTKLLRPAQAEAIVRASILDWISIIAPAVFAFHPGLTNKFQKAFGLAIR